MRPEQTHFQTHDVRRNLSSQVPFSRRQPGEKLLRNKGVKSRERTFTTQETVPTERRKGSTQEKLAPACAAGPESTGQTDLQGRGICRGLSAEPEQNLVQQTPENAEHG